MHRTPIGRRRRALLLGALLLAFGVTGCRGTVDTTGPPDAGEAPSDKPPAFVVSADLVHPDDFEYLGAFRLPDDAERPRTFAYGGQTMTYNHSGDPDGPDDGFPGSLFVMGHNRLPYGELPDGNQVGEIAIPAPLVATSVANLGQATFLQEFRDVAVGSFEALEELPRVGMEYLDRPETGPRIHLAWGQHLQDEPRTQAASHAWFSPDLSRPDLQGPWFIGERSLYGVNDYLFEIPAEWAELYVEGRHLATGRFRDGGWSGMGPALYAYRPWTADGSPAPSGSRLDEVALLEYAKSDETDRIERCIDGYQHPDEWSGGAWLTANSGTSAVMFAGTKGTGARYWYGYVNPAGPDEPCVEREMIGQFPLCRLADGTPCPDEADLTCPDHTSERGWWSSRFEARLTLYDPSDLARVATGQLEPHEPQPYAYLTIDEHLFGNPSGIESEMLGTGVQRRYRLGDVAFDRANGYLYVLELFAEEARPVVHVWRVQ